MKNKTIENNLEKVMDTLLSVENQFANLSKIDISNFNKDKTAIVYVDMVKGFVNEGPLSSPRAETILKNIKELDIETKDFYKVFFTDSHTKNSVEFQTYPEHCLAESSESELVDDYDIENKKSIIIKKNSVNGFFAPKFDGWLKTNKDIKNFIIVGLVTDICIMNFALSLKAYFNQWDIESNIIVPTNCVETFDLDITFHEASLMNLFALYNMHMNGIKLMEYTLKET